jgi:hypothetical protein
MLRLGRFPVRRPGGVGFDGRSNQSLGGALKIPQELPSLNENWLVLVDKEGNPQLA